MTLPNEVAEGYLNTYTQARESGLGHKDAKERSLTAALDEFPVLYKWRKAYSQSFSDGRNGRRTGGARKFNEFMGAIGPRLRAYNNRLKDEARTEALANDMVAWLRENDFIPGVRFFSAFTDYEEGDVISAIAEVELRGFVLESTHLGWSVVDRPEPSLHEIVDNLVANGDTDSLVSLIKRLANGG